MSPESICLSCKKNLIAPTDEELVVLENKHHVDSGEERDTIIGKTTKHMCSTFRLFSEGGVRPLGVRQYAHGKLFSEDNY